MYGLNGQPGKRSACQRLIWQKCPLNDKGNALLINEISTVNQRIKIQKSEAAFMASGQKYSIGTSVSKVFYDEDKEKGVNREFSGVIKAYDA